VGVLSPCHGNYAPHSRLAAYFTHQGVDDLLTVDDIPALRDVVVPDGWFSSVRPIKARQKHDLPHRMPPTSVDRLASMDATQSPSDLLPSHKPCLLPAPQLTLRSKSPPTDDYSRGRIYDLIWNPSAQEKFTSVSLSTHLRPLWRQLPPLTDRGTTTYRRREPIDEQFLRRFSGCPFSSSISRSNTPFTPV
jgi:hypothetical protein